MVSAYFVSDGVTINLSVMSTQTWCFFVWQKNDGKEAVSISVNVMFLDMTSYYSFFLNAMNGTGCWYGSVHIFVKGVFLVEQILDRCEYMCPVTVASEIGLYLVTLLTVNSVQDWRKPFLIALHQVEIVGENKASW